MAALNRTSKDEMHKSKKLVNKALKDVRARYPSIVVENSSPTKVIFVSHSCISSANCFPELLEFFYGVEANCSFHIIPQQTNYREYMFVTLNELESAKHLFESVNGKKPPFLNSSSMPFYCLYASNFTLENEQVKLPGFNIIPNAVSSEQSTTLAEFIKSCTPSETLKKRTVIHFGHVFDYSTNSAYAPTSEIPQVFMDLIAQLKATDIPVEIEPDQVTINIYDPGQGIPSHVDTHSAFENQIIVVSLSSDVVIRFKDCANNATTVDKLIPINSVLLMQDAARYKYKHGIFTRRYDVSPFDNKLIERRQRISITFRKTRRNPCECEFSEFCDWDRNGLLAFPKADREAARLETKYVNQVYENIADHFDLTRHSLWQAFVKFLNSLPEWSLVFDGGCGNGKYLAADFNLIRIGSDLCDGLVKIAAQKGCSVFRSNLLELPLLDNSFDAVICAAVVHHFSTQERRVRAFKEISRVLRKKGRALVSGWSKEQGESFYQKMRANRAEDGDVNEVIAETNKLIVHDGTTFKQQDLLVPWDSSKKQDGNQFLRYYHVFVEGEMEQIIGQLENCRLINAFHEQGNWFVEFEKR